MANVETTINVKIAEILRGMRSIWEVSAEQTRVIRGAKARQPDILIRHSDSSLPPIIIENEFMPAQSVEKDAIARLGVNLAGESNPVSHVLALRTPKRFRTLAEDQLALSLIACREFEYALYIGASDYRFPKSGWMQGSLADLTQILVHSNVQEDSINKAVGQIELTVDKVIYRLSKVGNHLEKKLRQKDGEQTRRMAAVILLNAFIFYEIIAPAHNLDPLSSHPEYRLGKPPRRVVIWCWEEILKINYYPIFEIALDIIKNVPSEDVVHLAGVLHGAAEDLLGEGVVRSHDLFGTVFQRLISDRKYLAAFYTQPSAAALLAGLAVPEKSWNTPEEFVIADPACGTGTLLSAAYRRISQLHELGGGNMAEHHSNVMSEALIACDVMPAAVHLTTAMLAGSQPGIPFKDTHMYLLHYGVIKEGPRVGSMELLKEQKVFPVMETAPMRQTGISKSRQSVVEVNPESVSLVIMNPPYTRPTNHEGVHSNIPIPSFAAFGHDLAEQRALSKRHKDLTHGTCAHGNAGMGSAFVALAHRLLADGGHMALVLPLTLMAGSSWGNVRQLLAEKYDNIICVTLAAPKIEDCSFSADTGMAEVLLIARRRFGLPDNNRRGLFVCLEKRPKIPMEGVEYARVLRCAMEAGKIRKLEDGPYGGTPVSIGDNKIGEMLDVPLHAMPTPQEKNTVNLPWPVGRIQEMSLAQTAYALHKKRVLWLPNHASCSVPVRSLTEVATQGLVCRDINGIESDPPRGPFDAHLSCPPNATYPCLWAHDAKKETRITVEPDYELRVRLGMEEKAAKIWKKASRVHHNSDFRFNSQPLAAAFTEMPTLGGRAWPNLCFEKEKQETLHMLWANSTLGLLSYWWLANKQQGGRGGISVSRSLELLTLDVEKLSRSQLKAADDLFNMIREKEFLPAYLAPEDQTRAALDEGLFGDVLGLDVDKEALATLRRSFGHEPSVSGGKKRA